MSVKKCFLLGVVIFFAGQLSSFAQVQKVALTGVVIDNKTGELLPNVVVNIRELNLWTVADVEGKFAFRDIIPGEYTLTASCLGYRDYEMPLGFKKDIFNYKLKLDEESLALKEVTVTATGGRKMSSTSNINRTALEHLQVTNLSDAMQLLPGSLTTNPSLNSVTSLAVRDLIKDPNTAIGTSIIMDGARVSDDANMQVLNTAGSSGMGSSSASGKGVDVRQISVDNVESIEVIRGVASAEYGDLTSGAVVLKTKAGKSPWEVRFKTDPNLKQVYVSKGFGLGTKGGFLNVDVDYANSVSDTRTPAKSFGRTTMSLKYSNTFNRNRRPFRFNAKFSASLTTDKKKKDPDQTMDERFEAKDNRFNLNIYGNWLVQKPWLTQLTYDIAGSYERQLNKERKWNSSIKLPTTNAMESGEHVGALLPYEYYSNLRIEGIPVYMSSKVAAKISGKYGNIYNNFTLGTEWRAKGNRGDGKSFDYMAPPSTGLRPRSFVEPLLHEYAGFIEDKVTLPIYSSSLEISAGARFTGISTKAADYDMAFDPRLNARLILMDKNWKKKGLQYLALRGGWGIQHKMPLLLHLYPDPEYKDRMNFTYQNAQENYDLVVITTKVVPTENPDLKLQKSRNFEVGLDFKVLGINGNIAYFNEKMTDGYSFESKGMPYRFRRYHYDTNMDLPEYVNGEVTVNGRPVGYDNLQSFLCYKVPGNSISVDKWGFEYSLDFGKIPAIQTSVIVDGAYFYQKRLEETLQMNYESQEVNGEPYPYLGIYAGLGNNPNGQIATRLNTNVRLVTHIPQLKMVFTVTGQCVWMSTKRNIWEYKGKNLVYMKDENGRIVEGDVTKDSKYLKYVNPLAYMDVNGEVHPFTQDLAEDPIFSRMVESFKARAFWEDKCDPYFMLNLQLTKEIGKIASLSFYANNLTNSKPKQYYRSTGSYNRLNSDIFFGVELGLKF